MLIIITLIIIRTLCDVSFKMAVHRLHFGAVSTWGINLIKMVKAPFLWLGLFFGLSNVVVWCLSLDRFDLSFAYPFLSVSYIMVILAGRVLFKEHLDQYKIIGISLITAGAVLLFI